MSCNTCIEKKKKKMILYDLKLYYYMNIQMDKQFVFWTENQDTYII